MVISRVKKGKDKALTFIPILPFHQVHHPLCRIAIYK